MSNFDETAASLHSQAELLLGEIASIKEQLARARAEAHLLQDFAYSDWYHSATRALSHKQQQHQKVLHMISGIRKQQKLANIEATKKVQKSFEKHFIGVARSMLSDSLFNLMIEEAERRAELDQ